jgi:flagellar biogenesis protein FliO
MWRPEFSSATALVLTSVPPSLAWSDNAIPFRQDNPSSPLQLGLGYASALGMLALLALGLFLLKKRLGKGVPNVLGQRSGLQCVASLRMPMRTSVHVVSWRGREVMFAQSGEKLQLLSAFELGEPGARDHAAPAEVAAPLHATEEGP